MKILTNQSRRILLISGVIVLSSRVGKIDIYHKYDTCIIRVHCILHSIYICIPYHLMPAKRWVYSFRLIVVFYYYELLLLLLFYYNYYYY